MGKSPLFLEARAPLVVQRALVREQTLLTAGSTEMTLELPDGWFGRPFENNHELSIVAWDGPLLRIVLDRHEPLTLLIREPQHAHVDGRVLTIRAFAEASAELPFYGDPDHPQRLRKYTGGRFRFHA